MGWIQGRLRSGRRPAFGEAESDEPKGGGKISPGFEYWLGLGSLFGWVGRWAFIEGSLPVRLTTSHLCTSHPSI